MAGYVNVVHQGARISRADDPRLERVFRTLPTFRAASFTPPVDEGPDLPTRTSLAEKLGALTGTRPAVAIEALAESVRQRFGPEAEVVSRVVAGLRGLGLRVPDPVTRTADILERLRSGTDSEVVSTSAQTWTDLVGGCKSVSAARARSRRRSRGGRRRRSGRSIWEAGGLEAELAQ